MGGARYYTYARRNVGFWVLDSDLLDPQQRAWIEGALTQSTDDWKICYFHHPLYSDGRTHGSQVDVRVILEPLFVAHGVNVVFSGHDHVYERLKPQKGITYFVSGAGGQLRKGDVRRRPSYVAPGRAPDRCGNRRDDWGDRRVRHVRAGRRRARTPERLAHRLRRRRRRGVFPRAGPDRQRGSGALRCPAGDRQQC